MDTLTTQTIDSSGQKADTKKSATITYCLMKITVDTSSANNDSTIDWYEFTENPLRTFEDNISTDASETAKFFDYLLTQYNLYTEICKLSETWQTKLTDTIINTYDAYLKQHFALDLPAIIRFIAQYKVSLSQYKDLYDALKQRLTERDLKTITRMNTSLLLQDTLAGLAAVQFPTLPAPGSTNRTLDLSWCSKEQFDAITSDKPLNQVQAGAGTGKSTVIKSRLDYLEYLGVDLNKVMVLSFTNAAADNIKARCPKIKSMTIASMIDEIYTKNHPTHQLSSALSGYKNNSTFTNSLQLYRGMPYVEQLIHAINGVEKNNDYATLLRLCEEHHSDIIAILDKVRQTTFQLEIILSSEFIEIPSRRFHTIYLDDVMLSDIINSNYNLNKHITTPMNGDIIRVIYSCSDVTNKALNKSLLETAIYKHTNAFFVQEIIPAEIKITVDKTAMRNTATPIENLRAFLKHEQKEHNSISDAQLNDCIGLAQPIIDRTLANKTNNHNVGVFMPIEIEVKNYRNYKDAVFNYNDVKFCVINGDNGAGKSSLFMDAMLDALFEETREGDITGWINNDINVRSGSIRFTFAIGDNTYRIIRTRQKSGKATLNISQLVTNNTGSQSWVDMSEEKIKDTQAVINRIIGMNAITLKSCGLIMQDAYGLFLQADKNTRMDILGDILELDVYDDLNNAASEFSLTCQRELDKITNDENNINANLADGPEIQKQLTAVVNENNARLQELTNCSNELITCTLKRDAMLNEIESYNRLSADINELVKKRQDLNFTLEEQNTVLMNAYQIVSGEKAYFIQRYICKTARKVKHSLGYRQRLCVTLVCCKRI